MGHVAKHTAESLKAGKTNTLKTIWSFRTNEIVGTDYLKVIENASDKSSFKSLRDSIPTEIRTSPSLIPSS